MINNNSNYDYKYGFTIFKLMKLMAVQGIEIYVIIKYERYIQ